MVDFITEADDTSLPTTGYILGADSNAAARPSKYTAAGVNAGLVQLGFSFSGTLPLTEPFYGAGSGFDALMWNSVRPTMTSETMPEVAQRIYIASGAGGSVDPANAFKMCQYLTINGSAGTGDIFGQNIGVGLTTGAGNVNATGCEIDLSNTNQNYGDATTANAFSYAAGKQFYGIQMVSGSSTFNLTAAYYVTDSGGGAHWNRGIAFDTGIRLYSIEDGSNAQISYRDTGSHTTGIDLSAATYSGTYAIKLPNNKGISAKDSGGTERNLIALSAANTIDIGTNAGHTGFLYMSILAPSTDNTLTLGGTANRFAAVHALNVYAQNVGQMQARASVNFNAGAADTAIAITLPTGMTRYRVVACSISGASATLTTATAGLFTSTGGGGVAVVTAASAITVSTASENTNNNMMGMTVNNSTTQSYTAATLYFRVATPQGSAATGTVSVTYIPVS